MGQYPMKMVCTNLRDIANVRRPKALAMYLAWIVLLTFVFVNSANAQDSVMIVKTDMNSYHVGEKIVISGIVDKPLWTRIS